MPQNKFFTTNILSKLFKQSGQRRSDEPLDSGILFRSPEYQKEYESWLNTSDRNEAIHLLNTAYGKSNAFGSYSPAFQFYESNQANGFYFNTQIGIHSDAFSYIFDMFRDTILTEGYSLYISDTKTHLIPAGSQKVDRHYLKPTRSDEQLPIDQKFGNVNIELYQINDQVQYLKLMANIYSDRNFKSAEPFERLLEQLFRSI